MSIKLQYPTDLDLSVLNEASFVDMKYLENEEKQIEYLEEGIQNQLINDYLNMFLIRYPIPVTNKIFWYWDKIFLDGDVYYFNKSTQIFCTKINGCFIFQFFLKNKKTDKIITNNTMVSLVVQWLRKAGIFVIY